MLQTVWLKQQKFLFSQFWRLDVYDQGLVGLAAHEASPQCVNAVSSQCLHMALRVCVLLFS